MIWNIILPKLLFKTKPCLPANSWPHFNPKGIAIVSFHTDTKKLGKDTVLKNRLPPSSEYLLRTQTVIYSETLLPRSHVILTYTTICLFTTVKIWSRKPSEWLMQEKLKYRTSQPIRCTVIFSLEILEKNNDECILILVIYWKKTELLHTKISNHNIIYSS